MSKVDALNTHKEVTDTTISRLLFEVETIMQDESISPETRKIFIHGLAGRLNRTLGDLYKDDRSSEMWCKDRSPGDLLEEIFQSSDKDSKKLRQALKGMRTKIFSILHLAGKNHRTRSSIESLFDAKETGHLYRELLEEGYEQLDGSSLMNMDLSTPRRVSMARFDLWAGDPTVREGFLFLGTTRQGEPYYIVKNEHPKTGEKTCEGYLNAPLSNEKLKTTLFKFID